MHASGSTLRPRGARLVLVRGIVAVAGGLGTLGRTL